jgi:putative MATE family efflux protein
MHGKNLTEGSIPKEMWSLAWPLMLSVFFYTLYNTVDAFWVGKISAEAIAAVGISQITLFAMVAVSMGITAGSGVLMAMNIGAKKMEDAQFILGQSFVLSVITGLVVTAVALAFGQQLLSLAGATGGIFPLAVDYYTITAGGMTLLFIMMAVIFAFNAQGDTFTLTKLFAVSTFANIVLDPLLIFGYGWLPAMGIKGAAVATLLSQALFIAISVRVLSHSRMLVPLAFSRMGIKLQSVKKVFAIGVPAALTNVTGPLGMAAITAITAKYFNEAGAISASLGFRIEFFAFLPAIGYGFGAMALLGQNIGAGNFERAKKAYKHGLTVGFLVALSLGVVAALFAKPLIQFFTTDAVVVQYTSWYLWTVPLSYGFLAALLIEAMAFQGIGRSWPGFWISLFKFGVVAVPLSIVFTQVFGMSIIGVWLAVVVGNVLAAAIGYVWLSRTLEKHLTPKLV